MGIVPSEEYNEQIKRDLREGLQRARVGFGPPGRWHKKGSAGGASIISFSVISSDAITRSALVDIRQRAFSGQVFGSILGDTVVTVYDTDGCYLNEPNVDLTGRRGKALLTITDQEAKDLHFGGAGPAKYWNVLSLCCPQVVCE